MKGGVGRYTYNLVNALKKRNNIEIFIAMSNRNNKTITTTNTYTTSSLSDSHSYFSNNGVYYDIVNKGDKQNSDRLLNLIDKFYKLCPVPTVSTLHTVLHYNEYKEYIKELALKKEGRFAGLPTPLRAAIRRLVFEKRYKLLLEIINLSKEIISLAKSNQSLVKRGIVIYHGAESAPSLSAKNKQEYRREFGLPTNKRLLLAFGYVGSYKGFDILSNLKLPDEWSLVIKQNKHERGREQPVQIKNAINLHLGYLDDLTLSKLFFACDAIIFPYRVVSFSGVLFDALAHGLPFIASDLSFFQEFAQMELGITCRRDAKSFSESLINLATDYEKYHNNVLQFNSKLKWDNIANNYIDFFSKILNS